MKNHNPDFMQDRNSSRLVIPFSLLITLPKLDAALRREVHHAQQEGTGVQAQDRARNAERRVALAGEGPVSDLGGLEGDDHVRRGSEHGEVAGDCGAEADLHPVVGRGVGEGGREHLDDGHVRGDVGEDGDDEYEPVEARHGRHLLGAPTHGDLEEPLRHAGVVERADQDELADEKHEQTVVDLGQRRLGLGH
ncbi:hypothetical protein THAOC_04728 [Thalassiosira oceanica]|uniref:Uncharacterized protein n=1 Tax=Thalassiosira oceanica TaxID=159749 RepID=K0T9A3_THAOC|nr:hypothetical protein THAOC_04728 [Thalassiosira oceanica]|eukprot:EJK73634.1 hypothetical protein THAOC_04728 [Thalassiosira oceanica]